MNLNTTPDSLTFALKEHSIISVRKLIYILQENNPEKRNSVSGI